MWRGVARGGRLHGSVTLQVLSCVAYPDFIKTSDFPEDVKKRAQDILNACGYVYN